MYNRETIVSQISQVYYTKIYGWLIALTGCAIKIIYDLFVYHYSQYLGLILVLIVMGVIGRLVIVGRIKRLTVTPDHIIVDYVGNKPQEVIDYTQINSNRNDSTDVGKRYNSGGQRRQILGLDDGRELVYTNSKFENYDDLKNHIYWYWVTAKQHRAEINSHI